MVVEMVQRELRDPFRLNLARNQQLPCLQPFTEKIVKLKDLPVSEVADGYFLSKIMNLVGKSECCKSPRSKSVVSSHIGQMPGVVQGEDTDVVAAANFKTIYPAI
jgi:hypothetical protein